VGQISGQPVGTTDDTNGGSPGIETPMAGTVVLLDDGNFWFFDVDGNPLGWYEWCDEEEDWLYFEFEVVPIPRTGDTPPPLRFLPFMLALAALTFFCRHGKHKLRLR